VTTDLFGGEVEERMSILEIKANSWDEARSFFQRLAEFGWVFRGHLDASWSIQTAFERMAQQFTLGRLGMGAHLIVERTMLRQFMRRAHHFVNNPPEEGEKLEWLALVQHHGGPTRLLDFTRSFYVAAFFALESDPKGRSNYLHKSNRSNQTNKKTEESAKRSCRSCEQGSEKLGYSVHCNK
jgi:hypothetical protein